MKVFSKETLNKTKQFAQGVAKKAAVEVVSSAMDPLRALGWVLRIVGGALALLILAFVAVVLNASFFG